MSAGRPVAYVRLSGWFVVPLASVRVSKGTLVFAGERETTEGKKWLADLTGMVLAEFLGEDKQLVAAWRKDVTSWGIPALAKGTTLVLHWKLDITHVDGSVVQWGSQP